MSVISAKQSLTTIVVFLIIFLLSIHGPVLAQNNHLIQFRSPSLYPEALVWDSDAQHFLLGSLHQRIIAAVSDAGVVETFISDPSLPENISILGLAVDSLNNRVLAVIHAVKPLPPFNALAAYDLRSRKRLFLSLLPAAEDDHDGGTSGGDGTTTRPIANDVAVDYKGNAFVTNSAGNYIWKVNLKGEASIFSKSPLYTAYPVFRDTIYSFCGLNGIAYVNKGYLLVVQSNTGKMFKVDADDGTARLVLLNEDLMGADDIAIRNDGVVLVVSPFNKLWYLKSQDSWAEGVVYEKNDLHLERYPTSVAVGAKDRVYVLYGYVNEGIMKSSDRESFSIAEMRSQKEGDEEGIWMYVLIGIGFAYFLYWRFQMGQLVKNMDKKIN